MVFLSGGNPYEALSLYNKWTICLWDRKKEILHLRATFTQNLCLKLMCPAAHCPKVSLLVAVEPIQQSAMIPVAGMYGINSEKNGNLNCLAFGYLLYKSMTSGFPWICYLS